MKRTVVAAEAEVGMRKFLSSVLKTSDYNVLFAVNSGEVMAFTASYVPDFLIIDVDLPDVRNTIESVREWSSVPIIAISESNREADKIEILDMGADDYIVKPMGSGELLARMRAILRRSRLNVDEETGKIKNYHAGELDIDFDRYRICVGEQEVHLTNNEFKIITLLAKYSGKVLTYDYILKEIWGPFVKEDNKTLRVNMANLRKKLEKNPSNPEYLFTEPGVGYRIRETEY